MNLLTSIYWVSLCIYHEARGESKEGQIAVAQVVLNRSEQRGISVKEVIFQPHQFSWVNDGNPDDIKNHSAFVKCLAAAVTCLCERTDGKTLRGANLYHSISVSPYWANNIKVKFIKKIGNHLFYREGG